AAPACSECPVRQDCHALAHDRVAELPTPRTRKRVPMKRACFLLAVARDTILLEQRPPTGIWGSLLAPPQFANTKALRSPRAPFAPAAPLEPLPVRRHGFTHFTLAYRPYLARIDVLDSRAAEPMQRWIALDAITSAPLPAPMRVLLTELSARLARES